MQIRSLPSVLVLLMTSISSAQEKFTETQVNWLRENAVPVTTIDPGIADDDFADLAPLRDSIGAARIVGLGEQTHGDGATFHAKVRLTKFLHQKMGFSVLVWESGMYSCDRVERALRKGESIHEAWRKGIFGVWGASAQVQPLFDYLAQTRNIDRPLEIAGMDSQMTGQGSAEALLSELIEIHERAGRPPDLQAALDAMAPYFESVKWSPLPNHEEIDYTTFQSHAARVITALRDATGPYATVAAPRRRALLARSLTNFGATVEMIYWGAKSQSSAADPKDRFRMAAVREPHMADTLVWLARERFPDRKLILWAASSHLTFNSRKVEWPTEDGSWKFDDADWEPMGNRVREELGTELYVVDFLAYEGTLGSVAGWSRPLSPPPEGSFDDLCHRTEHANLFLDLRTLPDREGGAWLRDRRVARPRGYAPMRANWTEICDAFFFTDAMFPSTRVEASSEK